MVDLNSVRVFSASHTKGCSRSSVDSPGARTLVFAAFNFEPFLAANFGRQWREHPFVRYSGALPCMYQGPLNGGVSNGGVSRSGLVLPFLSFFVLLGLSRGFSRFARGWSGDFPDLSFSSFSAY